MIEYVHHLPEGEDIGPEGRAYRIKEEILEYQGRKILCIRSEAGGGLTFCDGSRIQTVSSIFVKGYIITWKAKKEGERSVSRLEAIEDSKEKQEIREILEGKYQTPSIYFDSSSDY